MEGLMTAKELQHLSAGDRAFVAAFDEAMGRAGYDCGGHIGPGYCWGRHMLIYRRTGARSQNVVARVYIRDGGVALRLFLNGLDKHRAYLQAASPHALEPFLNDHGRCGHCHNQKGDACRFRKTYTLFGKTHEKCNGFTFEYAAPQAGHLDEYMGMIGEFYPRRAQG